MALPKVNSFSFYNFSVVSGVYEDAESISITYNTVFAKPLVFHFDHFNQSALKPILGQTLHLLVPKLTEFCNFSVVLC